MAIKRFVAVGVVLLAGSLSGCGPSDPPSDAPGLAGSWLITGEGTADGCWVFDETGDPVSFSPTNDSLGLGIATLNFDSTSQSVDVGGGVVATLVSTGSAKQDGDAVTVQLDINVSVVVPLVSVTIDWEANITTTDLTCDVTVSGSSALVTVPTATTAITGTLGGC